MNDPIPLPESKNPRTYQGWDKFKALANSGGKPCHLVRSDGSSSGLYLLPNGQLRRTTPKRTKAEKKAAKKRYRGK